MGYTITSDCCLQPLPLRGFDEECRSFIAEQYEVSGLNIHAQSTPTSIEKKSDGSLTLHVKKKDGGTEAIEGLEAVLMATGRSPNTQNMNLEKVSDSARNKPMKQLAHIRKHQAPLSFCCDACVPVPVGF